MKIYPCAKINLGLNVVCRRSDGYHDLETVFYPVDIFDEIEINTLLDKDDYGACSLTIQGMPIEGSAENNLIVKAYRMLNERYNLPSVHINLTKRIPMQAGMGGGSSDCAYTIRLLNEMFKLNLTKECMREYAATLGADCAFFIDPQPAFAEGIGDKLTPIDICLSNYKMLIVKPDIAVSTKEAFSLITPHKPLECCRDIISRPIETWRNGLVNDFERSIFTLYPAIGDIKKKLYDMGAIYASMSGSGSALFGIFNGTPPEFEKSFENCYTYII